MTARTLVAGIGNIFQGDDGFGVEVVSRLSREPLPEGTVAEDFGIRGLHLAYELLDGYDRLILVDAIARNDAPGTISVIDVKAGGGSFRPATPDAHDMDPEHVLGLLRTLGGHVEDVLVVGCEAADTSDRIGLSEPVAAAVGPAMDAVRRLITDPTTRDGAADSVSGRAEQ